MLRHVRILLVCASLLCVGCLVAATQHGPDAPDDPFMGDWQGVLKAADGKESPICAQVICWGKAGYQANLLDAFDTRVEPIAVLKGEAADGQAAFGETARIADGAFTGGLTGERTGAFTMEHVVRLSPTLGEQPPEGAVILFDGTSMDEWQARRNEPWMLNLARLVRGNNRVVYLRSRVWSLKAQPALLELGSDDAVKAWVNGDIVHSNFTHRPVRPWEDRADIELHEGWNSLLMKIVQGGGGWGACARVRSREGADLEGLRFEPEPKLGEGVALTDVQGESTGTIVTWELSGPYTEEGGDLQSLFDAAFPPEEGEQAAVEWRIVNDTPQPVREWKLVEGGAMEITPGAGTIVSEKQFTDHKVHLEFRTPFRPDARGQGRGNSGVYLQARYEVQILDSYGLEGKDNECGGIYKLSAPLVNMCAPPLQWQTFDIEFRAARLHQEDNKIDDARMTVYHNGVLIQDDVRIPVSSTGGQAVQSGGLLLQDHGNPVRFRNIWVMERREH
jgi:hypothetical protein